jgi:hypothetical protein
VRRESIAWRTRAEARPPRHSPLACAAHAKAAAPAAHARTRGTQHEGGEGGHGVRETLKPWPPSTYAYPSKSATGDLWERKRTHETRAMPLKAATTANTPSPHQRDRC